MIFSFRFIAVVGSYHPRHTSRTALRVYLNNTWIKRRRCTMAYIHIVLNDNEKECARSKRVYMYSNNNNIMYAAVYPRRRPATTPSTRPLRPSPTPK